MPKSVPIALLIGAATLQLISACGGGHNSRPPPPPSAQRLLIEPPPIAAVSITDTGPKSRGQRGLR